MAWDAAEKLCEEERTWEAVVSPFTKLAKEDGVHTDFYSQGCIEELWLPGRVAY